MSTTRMSLLADFGRYLQTRRELDVRRGGAISPHLRQSHCANVVGALLAPLLRSVRLHHLESTAASDLSVWITIGTVQRLPRRCTRRCTGQRPSGTVYGDSQILVSRARLTAAGSSPRG
jgi:hypothetical protein